MNGLKIEPNGSLQISPDLPLSKGALLFGKEGPGEISIDGWSLTLRIIKPFNQ
jgi:hypothetical protein